MITVNTPNDLRKAAKRLQEINVKPEIEAFDLGNMWFGAQLYKEGLLKRPTNVSNVSWHTMGRTGYNIQLCKQ